TTASVLAEADVWEKVRMNVASGHMPPTGMPAPAPGTKALLLNWIDSTFSQANCKLPDPGRVTVRRLNRVEYDNTIRDLTGLDLHLSDDFPSDDVGYGFDNIGDVLSLSPMLMEKYMNAAEVIAEKAIALPDPAFRTTRFSAQEIDGGAPYDATDGRILASEGEVTVAFNFPKDGDYRLGVRAFGQQAGPDPARMTLRLDGKDLKTVDVPEVEAKPGNFSADVTVTKGKHTFAAAFINDYYNEKDPNPNNRDRNLVVNGMSIAGPLGLQAHLPESHLRILFPRPPKMRRDVYIRQVLERFATRAYRRPATDAEVDRLAKCVQLADVEGDSFERGIQLAVEATLVSPQFLFRVEMDPDPKNSKDIHPLNDYELASRLSYFLWSSMPDDELFDLAKAGTLHDPAVLSAQVKRMLSDPKSDALVTNFTGQWLELRNLSNINPDPARYPQWNDTLRRSMRRETELFFQSIMKDDRSILDFIDGKYTFVNAPLANLYGIPGVTGSEFRRVSLQGSERGGILSQASILTVTSNPTRTSPVKRGKFVMEQLLGTPVPPPPPNIPTLSDDKKGAVLVGTFRQRMEQHRKNPACASCHRLMDPIGFGMENYNPIGAWRTNDGKLPIDSSGTLADGRKFHGPAELRALLVNNKDQFARSLSEKMLTYALGRGLESYDRCSLDGIVKQVRSGQYHFSSLIAAVVDSPPFRERRGES
ncbi:MAG: DUF1592 domain-containing protein, partial [Chloroflexi bacterium]|nr:DUF1592 domain-containing protein [Chloroflexota bacterium]